MAPASRLGPMGRTYEAIEGRLLKFITSQPVFFVATAPLSADGMVNCSPKGNRGELVVLDGRRLAYLDQTGSGIETLAHLRENGRIVLMFCAFTGPPRILRVHGRGRAVAVGDPGFAELAASFPGQVGVGARAVVIIDVQRISDSCGYGVPLMELQGHRPQLDAWAERKGTDGIAAYWEEKNRASIDGLPGLTAEAPAPAGEDERRTPASEGQVRTGGSS